MTEAGALDRIQALALLSARREIDDVEFLARVLEVLEAVGRPIIEDG